MRMLQAMSTTHTRPPVFRVMRWSTPDSRKPWFKDYVLACGHVLVHRPLRRGSDGRLHVAQRMPCPHCGHRGSRPTRQAAMTLPVS